MPRQLNVVVGKLLDQDVDVLAISVNRELVALDPQSFEVKFEIDNQLYQNEAELKPYWFGTVTPYDLDGQKVLMVETGIQSRDPIEIQDIFLGYVAAFDRAADAGAESMAFPLLGYRYPLFDIPSLAKALSDSIAFSARSKGISLTLCVNSHGQAKELASLLERNLRAETDFRNLVLRSEADFEPKTQDTAESFKQNCPECGEQMLPITYGLPSQEDFENPNFYSGGCIIMPDNPEWGCRACGVEF